MASVSKNVFWLSTSRIVGLALLFLAYTRLFSYLGPFGTGQYQFVLSVVTIFGIVVDLGVSQYVTKRIAEDTSKAAKYFYNFLLVECALALLVFLLLMLFVWSRGYEPIVAKAMIVSGLGMLLYGLTIPFLSVLSGFQELRRVAVNNLVASLANVTVIFAAVAFDFSIVFLATNTILASSLSLCVYYWHMKKFLPSIALSRLFTHVDWGLIRKIFIHAAPFALLVSFSTIYNRIDVVLITKFLGYEQTGLYTTAYKVLDLSNFFPASVSHSLYPMLALLMSKGALSEVRLALEKYLKYMIALALPVGVVGSLLSEQIIMILTNGDTRFLPAAPVLSILVWAIVILFIYITVNALVISQLTRLAVFVTGANVVVNIVGNILLLPTYGIKGAAVMTVISELIQGVFYFYFVRKRIAKFNFFWQFARPLGAAAVMGVVIWCVKGWQVLSAFDKFNEFNTLGAMMVNFTAVALVGFSAYVLALFVFRFFSSEDKTFILKFVRKI